MEESNSKTQRVSSKSWTHNRTTETDTRKAEMRMQGNAVARPSCPYCKSWMNAPDYNAKARINKAPAPTQDTLKPKEPEKAKEAEKPKTPVIEKLKEEEEKESDEVKIESEPNSPMFSVRALSDQDKSKFSASQASCGDVDALHLVSTASP